jgi:hypothetical protein
MIDRIATLEAQILAMQAELQALKGERPALPSPVRDEGARVVPLLPERTDGMPNLREMEKLYAAVRNLSPWPEMLRDRYDDGRPFRAFSSTFRWMMNVPRGERPNGKVALSFWLDTARVWLRARNSVASDLEVNALVLSAFAAGDVCYCRGDPALGCLWEVGLLEHGGRPADPTAWRRILTQGAAAVLPPSAPARRMAAPSPVRIYGG